jgi:glycosyltransferase involved in cell wall biosynthesis
VWNVRHSTFSFNRKNFKNIILRFILALISWFIPKKVIFCSKSALEIHARIGYRRNKLLFVPNGYSNSFGLRFFDDVLKSSNDGIPRFGMLARYNEQKDHVTLLEACAIVRDRGFEFELHIGGKDIDNDNCELAAIIYNNNLTKHVFLHGFVDDTEQFWSRIDFGVLSSKSGEAFPNVIAEAMLCGVPCIVTNVGDSALIVGDSGWVVPPSSKLALSGAICDAIRERMTANWRSRCKDARQKIEVSYSIDQSVLTYKNIWNQVTK